MAFPVLPVKEMEPFTQELFDRPEQAQKAARILKGILEAQSPRLSDIAQAMPGNPVSDGKTLGFWCLVLARPYHRRALPFAFIPSSEGTWAQEVTSRNLEHQRAVRKIGELLGKKPLVLDREFSYEGLFQAAEEEGVQYVGRLNLGSRPTLTDAAGNKLTLSLKPGERMVYRGVFYKGKVKGNGAGEGRKGLKEPLGVFTTLEPEQALAIYQARMKLDQSFRDLKTLLGLEKIMNKKREPLEKMLALVLLAYGIGLLVGEALRKGLYRGKKAPAVLRAVHPAEAPAEAKLGRVHCVAPASLGAV